VVNLQAPMRRHTLAAIALLGMVAPAAHAHIELDEPLVRHSNGDNGDNAAGEINKDPPCGLGGASDVRNPARVTTLLAGSTYVVKFRETIGHTGRNRVAFSPDGNVQTDFDQNVLAEIPDPPGSAGNTGDGIKWEMEITVPSEPCDNCTLQVIQAMSGNTEDPVGTPSPTSTYFQCADITIVAEEGELLPPPEDDDGPNDQPPGCAALPVGPLTLLALFTLGAARRRASRASAH
jgi:MYXO-CTERM domain-containing protein